MSNRIGKNDGLSYCILTDAIIKVLDTTKVKDSICNEKNNQTVCYTTLIPASIIV